MMEEHFNESYVESDKHPATFLGQIQDWGDALSDGTSQKVVAKGSFNIHGVGNPRTFLENAMDRGVVGTCRPV